MPARRGRTWKKCVYRYYDMTGELLYIGKAVDPDTRWLSHVNSGAEWTQHAVKRVDEWFLTEGQADRAEREAIASEGPRANKVRYRNQDMVREGENVWVGYDWDDVKTWPGHKEGDRISPYLFMP